MPDLSAISGSSLQSVETAEHIKILILGAIPADAELIEQTLRRAGLNFVAQRVATQAAFIQALEEFNPDIVLSDYKLPDFDGLAAIERVRQKSADLPVIPVTDVLGDQAAVELIKAGASDYILKDELARLPTAVRSVLTEAQAVRARKQAEEALRLSEERYRSLVVAIAQIVWTTDARGEVIEDLPTWRTFTGQSLEQIKDGGWVAALHPDDRDRTTAAWSAAVRAHTLFETEYRLRRHDAEYRYFFVRGVPVMEKDGTIREWVGVCTDITERKRHEEQIAEMNARMLEALREQAIRDPLTGLFNRQYLDETLMREIRRDRRRRAPFSVVMLDIDHFKIFNDTYGHGAGDQVLVELGKLLRDTVRASDIACRFGGEEFVVVLLDADLAAALPTVERICLEIKRKQCIYRGQELPGITVSAGLAQYPVHGTSAEELLRAADEALYAAKNAGRDRIEISSAHPEGKTLAQS
jgi:diguanylate cyclase (GGDEF)-like protein/PAS domain S-box-containing protein